MMEKFVVIGEGRPLSVVRVEAEVFVEIGEGDDLVSFSFDCGNTDEWRSFVRFQDQLGKLGDAANLKAYEMSHPDGEEEAGSMTEEREAT